MISEKYFNKIMIAIILILLLALAFLLLKPIFISITAGILLAYVFAPVHKKINKVIKSKGFSAILICVIIVIIILVFLWFLTPILVKQSFDFFQASVKIDFLSLLKQFFPSLSFSDVFAKEIDTSLRSLVTNLTSSLMGKISSILLNFTAISLQIVVIFFTLFFSLKNREEIIDYLKNFSPFSKETEKRLLEESKAITSSVIYGYVIIGTIQGLIAGIGFFVFSIPNALLLTFLAVIVGILPIIGPPIIWIPVVINLLINGDLSSAVGLSIFGGIASTIDIFLRPLLVSRKTRLPSSIILIGMIGGFFFLGFLGFVIGPLIIAYLMIVLELYRKKDSSSIFTMEGSSG